MALHLGSFLGGGGGGVVVVLFVCLFVFGIGILNITKFNIDQLTFVWVSYAMG